MGNSGNVNLSRTPIGSTPRFVKDVEGKVFINRKFYDVSFAGKDLTHADFRGATLVNCNFDESDLSYANFEGANCYRSSYRSAKLYHTSFKDAVLTGVKLDPKDMFGMTISVSCDTFSDIELGEIWLVAWLFLPTLGKHPPGRKEKIQALIVDLIGEERLKAMEKIFANREI